MFLFGRLPKAPDRRNTYRVRETHSEQFGGVRLVQWRAEYQRPNWPDWLSVHPEYRAYVSKADAIAACHYHASPESDPSITSLGRLP